MLIQIQRGVKLRLLRQEFLETDLMLKGATKLRFVIGQGLLLPLDVALLLLGFTVKPAQNMLDALNRAQGIVAVFGQGRLQAARALAAKKQLCPKG